MFLNNLYCIVSNYTLALQYQCFQQCLFLYYFTFTSNKLSTAFKYYTFISFLCFSCCFIISCSNTCNSSINKYVCITLITKNSIVDVNLMSLLVLYVPLDRSFISIPFFVLNQMVDLIYCVVNVLFFDIPLLYYYTNLNSSMICCLFSGDMYLSFGFSLSALSKLFLNVIPSKIFLNAIPLKHLLFFSAILLPIKFASAAF